MQQPDESCWMQVLFRWFPAALGRQTAEDIENACMSEWARLTKPLAIVVNLDELSFLFSSLGIASRVMAPRAAGTT